LEVLGDVLPDVALVVLIVEAILMSFAVAVVVVVVVVVVVCTCL